eukprot:1158227-Pelagomonas_calceolata.AAC.1
MEISAPQGQQPSHAKHHDHHHHDGPNSKNTKASSAVAKANHSLISNHKASSKSEREGMDP